MATKKREFIVVFTRASGWINRFLHKDISHVMVAENKDGLYISLDPTPYGLDTDIKAFDTDTLNMYRKVPGVKILRVTTYRKNNSFGRLRFLNCTAIVQYVIGHRYRWCITPYQLYRRLLKERSNPSGLDINILC